MFTISFALALALPALAGAVVVHVGSRRLGYEPLARSAPAALSPLIKPTSGKGLVEYHGGPVMTSNTNYAIYWDPAGAPAYPSGYESGIDRWFEDLAHDSGGLQNTDSVLTQYYGPAGHFVRYESHFAAALTDADPYPANGCSAAPTCLTDEQIQNELVKFVAADGLPAELGHEYFVITPAGVESCFEAAGKECSAGTKHAKYCAYHGFKRVEGGVIVYANIPYDIGLGCDTTESERPNGSPSDVALASGIPHEHSESVTDPELDAWYDSKGNEVADKCRTFSVPSEFGEPLGKAPDGSDYNQLIDGDYYWYQQEWSNENDACEQRWVPALPAVTKLSPKKGPPSGGTVVTVTGTGFTTPATVEFGAVASSEVQVVSPDEIVAVSPAEPKGTVEVTVTTSAGTSAPSKKAKFKYAGK